MGIDLSRAKPQTNENAVITAAPAAPVQPEIEVVQQYDIVADRNQMNNQLVGSEEVDKLASQIVIDDLTTIVSFGADAADEISKASDVVLNSMSMSQINDSGQMLTALAKIMEQFDIEEIKEDPGFFKKLFGNAKKQLDKILKKYHTMGDEVDKIYVQLRK
ncbi:MAG: toxic anion resistance protein, partial [Prevotella sp.]|nr:toxic anion resistance protein [Prevotella sp.]